MASRDGGGAAGDDAYSRRRRRRRAVTAISANRRGLGGRLQGDCRATSWRLHGDFMATSRRLRGDCRATTRRLQRTSRSDAEKRIDDKQFDKRIFKANKLRSGYKERLTSHSLRSDIDGIPRFDGDSTARRGS